MVFTSESHVSSSHLFQLFHPSLNHPLSSTSTSASCQLHIIGMTDWQIQYCSKDSCRVWLQHCLSVCEQIADCNQSSVSIMQWTCQGTFSGHENKCLPYQRGSSWLGSAVITAKMQYLHSGVFPKCSCHVKFRGNGATFISPNPCR